MTEHSPTIIPAEIIEKWMILAFRLFGNMLDNSEFSFFLSVPQFISQLSFLMSVCPERTIGLRREFGWNSISNELAHQIQHKNLQESTESFMKVWNVELSKVTTPGKILSARRAVAYPTNSVSIHLNTLECLREYRVELKQFEGAKEHRNWVSSALEESFEQKVVVNVWEEEILEPEDVVDKIGQNLLEFEERVVENEKKTPILMWISSASVAILPEIFDAQLIYPVKGVDYFRVAATPKVKIPVRRGEMPWNMIILPTVDRRLNFVLIYSFSRNLCPFDNLRLYIEKHRQTAPCIVRQFEEQNADSEEKRNVFIPHWTSGDFFPNPFAQRLQETLDIEEILQKGGFGDLAYPNSMPSAGGEMFKISHLQHFSTLSLHNSATTRATNPDDARKADRSTASSNVDPDPECPLSEFVTFPFCALLWDSERHVPVYMGKMTDKTLTQDTEPVKKTLKDYLFGWF